MFSCEQGNVFDKPYLRSWVQRSGLEVEGICLVFFSSIFLWAFSDRFVLICHQLNISDNDQIGSTHFVSVSNSGFKGSFWARFAATGISMLWITTFENRLVMVSHQPGKKKLASEQYSSFTLLRFLEHFGRLWLWLPLETSVSFRVNLIRMLDMPSPYMLTFV